MDSEEFSSKKVITTVRGDISPEELGLATMHEHVLLDDSFVMEKFIANCPKELLPNPIPKFTIENLHYAKTNCMFFPDMYKCDNPDEVRGDLEYFKKVGGDSLLDASPIEWRGNVKDLRQLSEDAGINIICSSGFFFNSSCKPEYTEMSEDALCEYVVDEITNGIQGSGIRPGIIKGALSRSTEDGKHANTLDMKALRANARAAAATGYGLTIHTTVGVSDDALLEAVKEIIAVSGIKPEKIILNHMCTAMGIRSLYDYANETIDREPKYDRAHALLNLGVTVGMDLCNNMLTHGEKEFKFDDPDMLRAIMHLVKEGYSDQIILGTDTMPRAGGLKAGWSSYARTFTYMLPMLRYVGCQEEDIMKMYHGNPVRILSH